jgi:serine/threonine protein kinase
MTTYNLNQTGIESLINSPRNINRVPNPTEIIEEKTFESVFGQHCDAGSFGTITQSPNGGVRKVLAFSQTPLVDLPGIHQNVKISHFNDKNYKLKKDDLSLEFTLSEPNHLHVVGGIMEGVILRSLQGIEGVVSYRDRTFTVIDGYIFMSTEMDKAPGKTTSELVQEQITLESALNISYNAALTLQQVHDYDIIHGDITPQNIMSDGQKTTITDFGNSQVVGLEMYFGLSYREANEKSFVVKFANDLPKIGTPAYFAPETFFEGTSISGDVFSMTTTTLYLTTGMLVAREIAEEGWSPKIYTATKEKMIENHVPKPVRQAILFNLAVNPNKRDLDMLISALGTSLGAELPAGVRAYSCPPVYAQTQSPIVSMDYLQQFGEAKTELLSGEEPKSKILQ